MTGVVKYVQKAVANGWTPPVRVMDSILGDMVVVLYVDIANLVELKSIGIVIEDRVVVTNDEGTSTEERKTTTFHTSIFNSFLAKSVFGDQYSTKVLEMLDNQGAGLDAWLLANTPN